MMLLGPVEIDAAGAHGFKHAFHPEGADVDVTEDDRDEENGNQAMHDLGELHSGNVRHVEREQQQISGYGHGCATTGSEPEDHFFSGVEAARLRALRADE